MFVSGYMPKKLGQVGRKFVQTLAKFLQKHISLWRFPPAFPLTNSDTIKSARVGGKKLGSVGKPETKVFFYLA